MIDENIAKMNLHENNGKFVIIGKKGTAIKGKFKSVAPTKSMSHSGGKGGVVKESKT